MEKLLSQFRSKFLYIFLGLVVFILLYPKFPLLSVPGTYVAIRLEDILIALVVGLWAILNFSNAKQLFKSTIFQAFLVFWLVGLLSVISGIFVTHSVVPHLGVLHFLRRVEMMLLFFVAVYAIKKEGNVITLIKTLFVTSVLVAFYGFGQIFLKLPVISTTNREFSKGLLLTLQGAARVNSTFAGHYDLAAYLSIILIFTAGLFFYIKGLFWKVTVGIFAIVNFGLLGLTAARVSFLGTLVGVTILLWVSGRKLLIIALMLVTIATIGLIPELRHRLIATVTVNVLEGGGPKYSENTNIQVTNQTPDQDVKTNLKTIRVASAVAEATETATLSAQNKNVASDIAPGEPVNTTELGVYRSYNIRLNVEWPRAIAALTKNPILGTGYSSITIATDNDILRSLGETGILGTLALALVFYVIIKTIVKSYKFKTKLEKVFLLSTICSVIAILVSGLFIDVLEASKVAAIFWVMLGVAYAIAKDYKDV